MDRIQALCEAGQQRLMRMEYVQAERILVEAEGIALAQNDFDALARLYMPLQESRRQRRQRCGEGTIRMDLFARGPDDRIEADELALRFPHGQLLVAGWGSIEPAIQLRRIQNEKQLYLDTFLAAVFPTSSGNAIAIVPTAETALPEPKETANASTNDLPKWLPPQSIVLSPRELPPPKYNNVMDLWERLHAPFLRAGQTQIDPMRKIELFRQTIAVDYACELAHQQLAETARELCKHGSGR